MSHEPAARHSRPTVVTQATAENLTIVSRAADVPLYRVRALEA